MIDLLSFQGRTGGVWRVRKKTDDSGDYPFHTYDVFAQFPWGEQGICYELTNPYDAALFAEAPELLEEVNKLLLTVYDLQSKIESASKILEMPIQEHAPCEK